MARLVTVGVRLVGLLTVLSVIAPLLHRRLRPELWYGLPQSASVAALVITVLAGAGLVMLAAGLRRGKRRAWQLSLAACVVLLVVHGVGRHPVPAGVVALMLAGLLGARREFTAGPDPVGRLAAARVVVQLLLGGFLVELLMLFVRPSLLAGHPSGWQRVEHAALALVGVSGPVTFRVDWVDDLTAAVGLSFGVAAVLVGGYFLLRSGEPRPSMTKDEESAVRRLLVEHGRSDSLGYFALRGDKSVVFSASGKAAVSYRVLAAVALASGDPLGNVEAWPGAISEFLTQCRRFGWVPAVLGCSESGAKVWTRHGRLDALELGDEAVIDVAGFSLQGRAMRSVRQAVSRVRRAGYQTQVRRIVDIPVGELAALRALVERWRGTPAERGFSMALSRFGEPELDPDALVVTATLEGQVRALLQFVPWGQDALSLDLMIRDASVPDNGLNELLIVDLLAACRDLEVSRVSLNFAVFRAALERGQRIGAGPIARLWARCLQVASRWWQIETLYRFNARFDPSWVPRFLMFDAVRDLPRIAVAAFEAEGYGGRPPLLLRLLRRR
jgi:lysyl-tRNA synthetase class 2